MRTLTHRAARQLPAALADPGSRGGSARHGGKGPRVCRSGAPGRQDDHPRAQPDRVRSRGPGTSNASGRWACRPTSISSCTRNEFDDTAMARAPGVARDAVRRAAGRSPRSIWSRRRCCAGSSSGSRVRPHDRALPRPARPQSAARCRIRRRTSLAAGNAGRSTRPLAARDADSGADARPRAPSGRCMTDSREQKVLRAAYSERQLEEVMVDFWFNHFNVFAGKGRDPRLPDRVRARRDPAARARQVPRSAAGHGREPGDAVLSRQLAERARRRRADDGARTRRSAGRADAPGSETPAVPERAVRCTVPPAGAARPAGRAEPAAARPQRELRARADGAAHARRRRRLHAEGRPGSRARVHRLDDSESRGRAAASVFEPRMHDDGEKSCSGTNQGGRRKAGRRAGARHPGDASRRPRGSSRPSWRAGSSPTRRRRRSSIARRSASARPTATSARSCGRSSRRRSSSRPRRIARRSRRRSSSSSARCARPGTDATSGLPLVAAAAQPRHAALHVPAADRLRRSRRRLGQHRRAAQPHELRGLADDAFAVEAAGRTPARMPADPAAARDALVAACARRRPVGGDGRDGREGAPGAAGDRARARLAGVPEKVGRHVSRDASS